MLKTIHHCAAALAATLAAGVMFSAQAQTPPPTPPTPPSPPSPPPPSSGLTINGAGFSANAEARAATPADIGLPIYPGAVPQRDKPGEGAGANLGLQWTGNGAAFGFRFVVLQYTSSDAMADVAAYYRAALAQHGMVLDCSSPAAGRQAPPVLADKTTLRCGSGDGSGGKAGELLYKVGTPQQFRTVALQPAPAGGVRFQLLRLVLPAD